MPRRSSAWSSARRRASTDAAVAIEVVSYIRGEGKVRFLGTQWAGRLGLGSSIEAFALVIPEALGQFQIEYRGLSTSGAETPWIGDASLCGVPHANTPLIGFAVRRRMSSGSTFFDCVYTGYFQSGAVVGPARNGAPCRSPLPNDPLEGLQVRIVERAP